MLNKKVIMAEFSDVRFDARVIKEAKALAESGYFVKLHMYNTSANKNIREIDGNIEYYVYSFKSKLHDKRFLEIIKRYYEAIKIITRINIWVLLHKADVYHAHNLKFLLSSFLASIFYKAKFVYDAHEIHSEHYDNTKIKGKLKNKSNEICERIILPKCNAFIQASDKRAEYVAKKYNVKMPYTINNYVPLKRYPNSNDKLREELGLKNDFPIMFYSGGVYVGGGRRFDKVLEALQYVDVYFVIVGFMNDKIRLKLTELVKTYSIESKVFILPPCPYEDLFEYASSADFGVIPLNGDALNTKLSALNKVSEYLMAGLPILCSNYENLEKIVYDNPVGIAGETFDVNSVFSIVDAIKRICDGNIYEYKKNALNLAQEFYNWEKEEEKLIEIYQIILRR